MPDTITKTAFLDIDLRLTPEAIAREWPTMEWLETTVADWVRGFGLARLDCNEQGWPKDGRWLGGCDRYGMDEHGHHKRLSSRWNTPLDAFEVASRITRFAQANAWPDELITTNVRIIEHNER